MSPCGGGFAAAVIPAVERRARLRGRSSGLKGRYHDRCATGLRPSLDPGASTAPHRAATRAGARAPARRTARRSTARIKIKPLQTSLYGFRGLPYIYRADDLMWFDSGPHAQVHYDAYATELGCVVVAVELFGFDFPLSAVHCPDLRLRVQVVEMLDLEDEAEMEEFVDIEAAARIMNVSETRVRKLVSMWLLDTRRVGAVVRVRPIRRRRPVSGWPPPPTAA